MSLPSSTSFEQPGERADCAAGFLDHALACYLRLGVRIERVLTDNGKVFNSGLLVRLCEQHQIKRLHTRYYRPHSSLGGQLPISRLQFTGDNVLKLHS